MISRILALNSCINYHENNFSRKKINLQVGLILNFFSKKCIGCKKTLKENIKKSNTMPKKVPECVVRNLLNTN